MIKVTAKVSTEPVAYVTKGKQRIKQYNNDSVYLNNGDEFELELFNPTGNKVLAKIELNGNSIGAGVVLRPGERVFIERYLDEARKFMFQTYEVNGKSEEVKRAIANNGNVKVLFYKEQLPLHTYSTTTWTTTWPTWGTYTYSGNNTAGNYFGNSNTTLDSMKDSSVFYSNSLSTPTASLGSLDFMDQSMSRGIVDTPRNEMKASLGRKMSKSATRSKSIETGRIDKGSASNQSFAHDYSTFEYYWTWKTEWKILPTSQKPLLSEDIKVFCTNCGAKRRKSSHKFCPNCGERF